MAVEVVLPMLGITVERGTITEWLKKEGDPVDKGEIIFIVEVEKATTEVESPAAGTLARILVQADVEVPVLTPVAIITEAGEELPEEYSAAPAASSAPAEAPTAPQVETAPTAPAQGPPSEDGPVKAMPAARKLAADRNIDLESIVGTGPQGVILLKDVEAAGVGAAQPAGKEDAKVSTLARQLAEEKGVSLDQVTGTGVRGRIMREDVERAAAQTAAVPCAGLQVVPMNTMRKVIARRMSESCFTAPHIYFFTDIAMDPLLDYRKSVLPDFEKKFGIRPSINDFLIKAVSLNLAEFPIVNAQIQGEEIHMMPDVNVCLAVALEEGLIVPALQGTDKAGLVEIVRQRADLVERARNGALTIEEMQRGTFTISSLAQYDITHFTAIINPPQSGILSVGKTREELYLEDGQVKVRKVASMGLSVDHRIIDGAVAADFLQNLKWKLERPAFTFMSA
jgi:pyruvate dehydrogenase E2 component (dihydrolipoamide acetyltransferase)